MMPGPIAMSIYQKMGDLKRKHDTEKRQLSEEIAEMIKACPHPKWEYEPDASGNNDSSNICTTCGVHSTRHGSWIPYHP